MILMLAELEEVDKKTQGIAKEAEALLGADARVAMGLIEKDKIQEQEQEQQKPGGLFAAGGQNHSRQEDSFAMKKLRELSNDGSTYG